MNTLVKIGAFAAVLYLLSRKKTAGNSVSQAQAQSTPLQPLKTDGQQPIISDPMVDTIKSLVPAPVSVIADKVKDIVSNVVDNIDVLPAAIISPVSGGVNEIPAAPVSNPIPVKPIPSELVQSHIDYSEWNPIQNAPREQPLRMDYQIAGLNLIN